MLRIKIGGVEEHFNTPWYQVKESEKIREEGIDLQWMNCPGGTGEMTRLLRNGDLDIAVLLTEGIILDIIQGNPARILKVFVQSKLEWGIHTSIDNEFANIEEGNGLTFAISKPGSGSQLMAMLNAKQKEIPLNKMKFKEVGSLNGALDAFKRNQVDVFLWEKFTTEPYCDSGPLKRIDSIVTPWPCFVIAASPIFYRKNQIKVDTLIHEVLFQASNLKRNPEAVNIIADRFKLSPNRTKKWFESVEWGKGQNLSSEEVLNVIEELVLLGTIKEQAIPKLSEILL